MQRDVNTAQSQVGEGIAQVTANTENLGELDEKTGMMHENSIAFKKSATEIRIEESWKSWKVSRWCCLLPGHCSTLMGGFVWLFQTTAIFIFAAVVVVGMIIGVHSE